ncbi:MAG: FKBP-type peptidyl-prolyl cis-trans isomerase, partial [Candidatus Helarchaeales archaeon]
MAEKNKSKKPKKATKTTSKESAAKSSNETISIGDKILINTAIRLADTNELIDTTYRELAEKEGIFDVRQRYGPQFIVVGQKFVFEEVDQKLPEMKVGEKRTFMLENPFGKRDPQNIKTYSIREFRKANIDVRKNLGKRVTFKGRPGYILSERGGRVRIDYNHPLADKNISYEVEIVKKLSEPREVLEQILKMNFQGVDLEKLDIEMGDKK